MQFALVSVVSAVPVQVAVLYQPLKVYPFFTGESSVVVFPIWYTSGGFSSTNVPLNAALFLSLYVIV